ncbi:MAG: hypothetical protein MHMPM18_000473 [Marteilia pararefringens]
MLLVYSSDFRLYILEFESSKLIFEKQLDPSVRAVHFTDYQGEMIADGYTKFIKIFTSFSGKKLEVCAAKYNRYPLEECRSYLCIENVNVTGGENGHIFVWRDACAVFRVSLNIPVENDEKAAINCIYDRSSEGSGIIIGLSSGIIAQISPSKLLGIIRTSEDEKEFETDRNNTQISPENL